MVLLFLEKKLDHGPVCSTVSVLFSGEMFTAPTLGSSRAKTTTDAWSPTKRSLIAAFKVLSFFAKFLFSSEVDGCLTLGPCWEKCVPPALEGSSDCEDGYENGDLNEREFLRCLVDLSVEFSR